MVDLDTFRALARSSPWLWSSVRLTRTMIGLEDDEQVRAWIRRPGLMRVEHLTPAERRTYVVDESREPGRGRALYSVAGTGTPQPPPEPEFRFPQDPLAPQPVRRPDGLVEHRPDGPMVVYDDPMHTNYLWVAMLDPVELADGMEPDAPPSSAPHPPGVEIIDVAEETRLGRASVTATVRPTGMYNPRCTCCALLFADVTVALLREEGGPLPEPLPALADAHEVTLDRATGICVRLRDIGGDRDGCGFDVEIEEVNARYPDALFRT